MLKQQWLQRCARFVQRCCSWNGGAEAARTTRGQLCRRQAPRRAARPLLASRSVLGGKQGMPEEQEVGGAGRDAGGRWEGGRREGGSEQTSALVCAGLKADARMCSPCRSKSRRSSSTIPPCATEAARALQPSSRRPVLLVPQTSQAATARCRCSSLAHRLQFGWQGQKSRLATPGTAASTPVAAATANSLSVSKQTCCTTTIHDAMPADQQPHAFTPGAACPRLPCPRLRLRLKILSLSLAATFSRC